MMNSHCGVRLQRLTPDTEKLVHVWRCRKCHEVFSQKLRQAKVEQRQNEVRAAFRVARSKLDYIIAATPTGPVRNRLTEANIHMMIAEEEWEREQAKISPSDGTSASGGSTAITSDGGEPDRH